jgi:DNA-binding NarL/FixJ family response regulator
MNEVQDVGRQRAPKGILAEGESRPHRQNGALLPRRSLIVVDRRTVICQCLCLWICTLGPEFHPISLTNIEDARHSDRASRASAVVFCTGAMAPNDDVWLREQVAWTRNNLPEAPLVLFTESSDERLVDATVRQLQLSGYIPTSSSLELAATALRLIVAGGRYVPQMCDESEGPTVPGPDSPQCPRGVASASYGGLTVREQSVLDLLELGLPNKVIGYRLGMSQSTAKAHVHNIVAKLNVHNRTAAAVARFAASIPRKSCASPASTGSVNDTRPLGETV